MAAHMGNNNHHLSGVKCVVNTCKFYQQGNYCTAGQIEIQAPNARHTQDTDCATFAPKG